MKSCPRVHMTTTIWLITVKVLAASSSITVLEWLCEAEVRWCPAYQNSRLLLSSVSYSPQRALAWKRETTLRACSISRIYPWNMAGIQLQLWHMHIMCRLLNWAAVHCSRNCQAMENRMQEGVKNGLKVYFIPSARSSAKHICQKGLISVLFSLKISHLWHGLHGRIYTPQIASSLWISRDHIYLRTPLPE